MAAPAHAAALRTARHGVRSRRVGHPGCFRQVIAAVLAVHPAPLLLRGADPEQAEEDGQTCCDPAENNDGKDKEESSEKYDHDAAASGQDASAASSASSSRSRSSVTTRHTVSASMS